MNILGFTGTSEGMTPDQASAVFALFQELNPKCLHHGMEEHADREAHDLARSLKMQVIIGHPGNSQGELTISNDRTRASRYWNGLILEWADFWIILEPKLPLVRNSDIATCSSHGLIAAPSGYERIRSGTWATVRRVRKLHRPIWIVSKTGFVTKESRYD